MTRPKTPTLVGIALTMPYLFLVTWLIVKSFKCGSVEYCLNLSLAYPSLPWLYLIAMIFYLLHIPDIGDKTLYVVCGLCILFNAIILLRFPHLLVKMFKKYMAE